MGWSDNTEMMSSDSHVKSSSGGECDCIKLSASQKIVAFGITFGIGFLMTIFGNIFLGKSSTTFIILYVLGTFMCIFSTIFIVGVRKQFKMMFAKTRLWATIVFLVAFILTIVIAFTTHSGGLTSIFLFVDSIALFWYCISYIPFARDAILGCIKACFACCF
ncbi:putative multi-domain containing protein [Aduncisulcus paluster]|uniref:Vesicle transport protein n=1 Tax=Aduncisulcus paluster TaxID=2918883 RepID=A0ABQ5JZM9_9EUKA|nr:putative multi-domain containing protein [Aduncisulcus paluster]|eukprot:gnl/Carplike_NY0171/432_a594_2243.p1 GENE.gnl/Carplike_NY0171/432_a594_2243~~gnl/Carplike_NY0171/432_a594_2243.p1  ORF type:complete len:162 (+),score=25.40 gnl/Carplike_NY0171/432_a594_2243:18-503(+)